MIITAWYQAGHIQLKVPDGYLVYDGDTFVKPDQAKTVMVINSVATSAHGAQYSVQETLVTPDFTSGYHWVCSVVSVAASADTAQDVLAAVDPLAGACLCGITCFGPQILNVPITQGN